jgi:hypothetical protein
MQVYLRGGLRNICNISMFLSFVMHLSEDGLMNARNMKQYTACIIYFNTLMCIVGVDIICNKYGTLLE